MAVNLNSGIASYSLGPLPAIDPLVAFGKNLDPDALIAVCYLAEVPEKTVEEWFHSDPSHVFRFFLQYLKQNEKLDWLPKIIDTLSLDARNVEEILNVKVSDYAFLANRRHFRFINLHQLTPEDILKNICFACNEDFQAICSKREYAPKIVAVLEYLMRGKNSENVIQAVIDCKNIVLLFPETRKFELEISLPTLQELKEMPLDKEIREILQEWQNKDFSNYDMTQTPLENLLLHSRITPERIQSLNDHFEISPSETISLLAKKIIAADQKNATDIKPCIKILSATSRPVKLERIIAEDQLKTEGLHQLRDLFASRNCTNEHLNKLKKIANLSPHSVDQIKTLPDLFNVLFEERVNPQIYENLIDSLLSEKEDRFPAACYCPLSQKLMVDPVSDKEGTSYERTSITSIAGNINGRSISLSELRPNLNLKSTIESLVKNEELPESCYCPITYELMDDPVSDSDGISYERVAITAWIEKAAKHPTNGRAMSLDELRPNKSLKAIIQILNNN